MHLIKVYTVHCWSSHNFRENWPIYIYHLSFPWEFRNYNNCAHNVHMKGPKCNANGISERRLHLVILAGRVLTTCQHRCLDVTPAGERTRQATNSANCSSK
jgi:hypothetical protein